MIPNCCLSTNLYVLVLKLLDFIDYSSISRISCINLLRPSISFIILWITIMVENIYTVLSYLHMLKGNQAQCLRHTIWIQTLPLCLRATWPWASSNFFIYKMEQIPTSWRLNNNENCPAQCLAHSAI